MNNLKPAGLDPGHTLALAVLGSVLRTREAGGGGGVFERGCGGWGVFKRGWGMAWTGRGQSPGLKTVSLALQCPPTCQPGY